MLVTWRRGRVRASRARCRALSPLWRALGRASRTSPTASLKLRSTDHVIRMKLIARDSPAYASAFARLRSEPTRAAGPTSEALARTGTAFVVVSVIARRTSPLPPWRSWRRGGSNSRLRSGPRRPSSFVVGRRRLCRSGTRCVTINQTDESEALAPSFATCLPRFHACSRPA